MLSNVIMSLLRAISHENELPHMAQSFIRVPHNTGCGYTNTIFLLTAPNHETDIPTPYTVKAYCAVACSFSC